MRAPSSRCLQVERAMPAGRSRLARSRDKPIGWPRCRARKVAKSGWCRHYAQEREWFGLFSTKPVQEPRSGAINIVGIDAIKFEGCTAMSARAQGIHARDARVQSSAGKLWRDADKEEKKITSQGQNSPMRRVLAATTPTEGAIFYQRLDQHLSRQAPFNEGGTLTQSTRRSRVFREGRLIKLLNPRDFIRR
ncbi:hypothetical protein ACVWWI_001508 [Bradyrhizobium sp. USDA 3686]|nr:hypothetical protein [Bradyrhizobium canariense]